MGGLFSNEDQAASQFLGIKHALVVSVLKMMALQSSIDDMKDNHRKLTSYVGQLEGKLKKAIDEAKMLKDPKVYQKMREEAFQCFLDCLETMKFEQSIPKKNGELHHILIGNISSGKTSLINYSCGLDLPVGVGETTLEATKVAGDGKIHIWDSPGVNEDFKFYGAVQLALFSSADRIFILYPDSLKSCKEIVQVLSKIKPDNTYLVRTQCDKFDNSQARTLEQEYEIDKKLIMNWGIKLPILRTSVKLPKQSLDNAQFIKLLTSDK